MYCFKISFPNSGNIVSICLDTRPGPCVSAFHIFLFIYFFFRRALTEFQWVPCTVRGTYKPLFPTKLSLKMSPTALFTHLKIILLQCFDFSVFDSIQTDPKFELYDNN